MDLDIVMEIVMYVLISAGVVEYVVGVIGLIGKESDPYDIISRVVVFPLIKAGALTIAYFLLVAVEVLGGFQGPISPLTVAGTIVLAQAFQSLFMTLITLVLAYIISGYLKLKSKLSK